MTSYRFCRTDDIGLLVEAHERCRGPEDAGEPALDREAFKLLIRELDLWCSSCMVAFEGGDPVGVLLGAKRVDSTLLHTIRVQPAHRRRGHARHLLTSLSSKLAILGPPKLVAEVPADRPEAVALFGACGWRSEKKLTQWRKGAASPPSASPSADLPLGPLSLDEALASGLLTRASCWERDLSALKKLEQGIEGSGFFSSDRLEALLFWRTELRLGVRELLAIGATAGQLGALGARTLVAELARRSIGAPLILDRAAPDEVSPALLASLGFERGPEHLRFATEAQSA